MTCPGESDRMWSRAEVRRLLDGVASVGNPDKADREWNDPEMRRLHEVMAWLQEGRLRAADSKWLWRLLVDITHDRDVRDRFFRPRARGDRRAPRRHTAALWIAIQTSPRNPQRKILAAAKYEAEQRFGLTESQVKRLWSKEGERARWLAAHLRPE